MNRFLPALMACIATCALSIPAASATSRHAGIAATATVRVASADAGANQAPSSHAKMRAARKGRKEPKKQATPKTARVAVAKVSAHDLAEARKAAALEQAQMQERADALYAVSQANNPILVDAKACRRVGANGESIYENC
ncbi:MAG TPA: hypothetical protein VGH80_08020 [Xanthomonadaceae bacterium]|jgi:hypothetical protein